MGGLGDALALIKQTKEAELARPDGDSSAGTNGDRLPTAEEGLHHLMLSTDVEALYRWPPPMPPVQRVPAAYVSLQRDFGCGERRQTAMLQKIPRKITSEAAVASASTGGFCKRA